MGYIGWKQVRVGHAAGRCCRQCMLYTKRTTTGKHEERNFCTHKLSCEAFLVECDNQVLPTHQLAGAAVWQPLVVGARAP